jgi:hypothetical protein
VIAAVAIVLVIAAVAFFATRDGGSKGAASSTTTTTTRPKTTTTTEGTVTTLPSGGDGTELLTSDGGQIEVVLPTSWTDHDTKPASSGFPELKAGTDVSEFLSVSFLEPGVDIAAFPATTIDPSDLDAALDQVVAIDRGGDTLDTLCTRGTRQDFTPNGTGLAIGRFERLSGCNGGGDVIIIAATNADLSFTVLMEVHVGSPPDDAGVDAVTSSFNVVNFP